MEITGEKERPRRRKRRRRGREAIKRESRKPQKRNRGKNDEKRETRQWDLKRNLTQRDGSVKSIEKKRGKDREIRKKKTFKSSTDSRTEATGKEKEERREMGVGF